jgi:bifunctional non-homologous end joining protein LigD
MVWDRGNYDVHGEDPLAALKKGRLHMVLEGKKIRGDWTLIRTRIEGGKNQWLLLKSDGDVKPISKKRDDESVKTGRTMKQIAKDHDAEWESHRKAGPSTQSTLRERIRKAVARKESGNKKKVPAPSKIRNRALDSLPSGKPRFIEPMKAKLVETAPTGADWIYELKFDGFRVEAIKDDTKVKLLSRNENDLTKKFDQIAAATANLPCAECVIDGEVVALDREGRSSFQLLQSHDMDGRTTPLYYYVFPIRYSGELGTDATALLDEVQRRGLEGIIGKQAQSPYEVGRRSGAWIKLKCVNEQEFVIGGYTPPEGARQYFGALLVGYYEKKRLLFAGKVGTGFTTKSLAELHKKFQGATRKECPFADLPSKHAGQWSQGITPGMMSKMNWVDPVFVCQVKFAEWTRDGKLRAPVFLGLRADKAPADVKRETPA